jgi:hypothetical protein
MVTIRDNGTSGLLTKREYLDIQNNSLASDDARGRVIVQNEYDMCSSAIHHLSMDSENVGFSQMLQGRRRTHVTLKTRPAFFL